MSAARSPYDGKGQPLQLALYLEGIRVPFIRAIVQGSVNQPLTCTIELPPFSSATLIRPRTLVHLFYWDEPFLNNEITDITNQGSPDASKSTWRLLFEGEVATIQIHQKDDFKSVGLVCKDLSNYWYHIYQAYLNRTSLASSSEVELVSFVNASENSIIKSEAIYNTSFPNFFGDFVIATMFNGFIRVAGSGAGATPVKLPNPRGSVVIALFDLLAATTDINKFFSDAHTRLKMLEKLFTFPDDKIPKYFDLKATTIQAFAKQFTGQLGQLGTLATVISKFLDFVFYSYTPIPAPPFATNPSRDTDSDGDVDPQTLPRNIENQGTTPAILSTLFKPATTFTVAPRCNVIYPSRVSEFHFSKSYLDEPTRLRMSIQTIPNPTGNPKTSALDAVVYAPPQANITSSGSNLVSALAKEAIDTLAVFNSKITNKDVAEDWTSLGLLLNSTLRNWGNYTNGANLVFDPLRDISEPEVGIVPITEVLDYNQALLMQISAKDAENPFIDVAKAQVNDTTTQFGKLVSYYLAAADYQLDLRKFSYRSVDDIRGPFNPGLILGLPGVLHSSMSLLLGDLTAVTHILDCQQGAHTVCTLANARSVPVPAFISSIDPADLSLLYANVSEVLYTTEDLLTGDPVSPIRSPVDGSQVQFKDRKDSDLPVILNSSFHKKNIDSNIYNTFGTRSTFGRVNTVTTFDATNSVTTLKFSEAILTNLSDENNPENDQFVAAFAQYLDYLVAPDKQAFVNYATRRNIASIADVRAFYGYPGVGINPIFNEDFSFFYSSGNLDEYLFGSPETGPFFMSLTGQVFTKQKVVEAFTKEIRIALGKDPSQSAFSNYDLVQAERRGGGVSGV